MPYKPHKMAYSPSVALLRLASDACSLRLRAELIEEAPWSKRAIFRVICLGFTTIFTL